MSRPPRMAPPMLSRPPTITAGSTLSPRMASDPSTPPRIVASRIPPTADTTAAMLHDRAKIRRTEMPIESATCCESAVARMAMPGRAARAVQVAARDRQRPELDRVEREDGGQRPRVGSPDALHDGPQHAGEAEGHHDHRDDRLADERAQNQALEHDAQDGGEGEGEQQRGADRRVRAGDGEEDVRSEQQELALREVQDAARLEDDDEAERDQRIDAAHHQAVEEDLEEELHHAPPAATRPTERLAWMRAVFPSWKRMVVSIAMRSSSP